VPPCTEARSMARRPQGAEMGSLARFESLLPGSFGSANLKGDFGRQ
jgi:hypothetical protein